MGAIRASGVGAGVGAGAGAANDAANEALNDPANVASLANAALGASHTTVATTSVVRARSSWERRDRIARPRSLDLFDLKRQAEP